MGRKESAAGGRRREGCIGFHVFYCQAHVAIFDLHCRLLRSCALYECIPSTLILFHVIKKEPILVSNVLYLNTPSKTTGVFSVSDEENMVCLETKN